MESIARVIALVTAGVTLAWLAGCGSPAPSTPPAKSAVAVEMERRQAEQDAAEVAAVEAADQAERERLMNEAPSPVTIEDMKRGKKITGSGILRTPIKAGIKAEQRIGLMAVEHALNLYMASEGDYPKSHEEFMEKIVEANQIKLEPLNGPYEYWYNAEAHQLYKRPVVQGEAERAAAAEAGAANETETDQVE